MVYRFGYAKSLIHEHPKVAEVFTPPQGLLRISARSAQEAKLPLFSRSLVVHECRLETMQFGQRIQLTWEPGCRLLCDDHIAFQNLFIDSIAWSAESHYVAFWRVETMRFPHGLGRLLAHQDFNHLDSPPPGNLFARKRTVRKTLCRRPP